MVVMVAVAIADKVVNTACCTDDVAVETIAVVVFLTLAAEVVAIDNYGVVVAGGADTFTADTKLSYETFLQYDCTGLLLKRKKTADYSIISGEILPRV